MKIIKTLSRYFNKLYFLEVGDIIWVKRYKNESEKESIEIENQEEPFVVIKKTIFNIYDLPSTSNIKKNNAISFFYELDKEKYNFNKTSYVRLNIIKKLEKIQFVRSLTKLDDKDLNNLFKKIYCYWKHKIKKKNKIVNNLKFYFKVGDIIKYQKKLY